MRDRRSLVCAAVIAVGCQRSDPPHTETKPAATPTDASVASTPTPTPARPVPPLPDPLPGVRRDVTTLVGAATRVAIADIDGDGDREIVVCDTSELRVIEPGGAVLARAPITAGIQRLAAADIDGDGRAEIFAGWGQTREHMDSKARLTVHRMTGSTLVEETLVAPETSRNEVTAIVPIAGPTRDTGGVLFAYFDSKYNVTSVIAKRGTPAWTTQTIASLRTATSYARGDVDGDGTADLVVGRVYGDEKGLDGDAFVLAPDGTTRTKIPSTRGLRSIVVADADGDGHAEVFLGDGWHQNYAAMGRGLVSWARFANGAFRTELVEDTAGQYSIEELLPATIEGRTAIVAVGSAYVRVFLRDGTSWRGLTIAGTARDVAVGELDGEAGDEIVVVGEISTIVKLRLADLR